MGERVALVRCAATESDAAVETALLRGADLVGDIGRGLRNKKKVLIKPNLGTNDVRLHQGRQVALTDPTVLAATVRLIRRFHDGDIVIGDATTGSSCHDVWRQVGHDRALRDLDVRVVDFKDGPWVECAVPGGGIMFDRYWMNHEFADADAIVSVAKLKSHVSTGSTGTLKNLFGMTPTLHYGSPRRYLHAPIRLPRTIADLGLTFPPVLCVIDGLVGQSEREWHGPPVETGLLIVGTNTIAVDAAAMLVQGLDPEGDYGDYPFLFDNNPLALAAARGLGPNRRDDIELVGDGLAALRKPFTVDRNNLDDTRRTRQEVAMQALRYRADAESYRPGYGGRIVALAGGQVIAAADTVDAFGPRAQLDGGRNLGGIFIKKVMPAGDDGERLAVYDAIAAGGA
ncbi:MAG: DUF362 domain-containing protein [Chloroflexi bacterium]|nr:DUF362 domain-containing protein [Chloroflexota bacterium]